jgi:hypothetical protein
MSEKDAVDAAVEKAHGIISDLCHGRINWRMSIPAQPDSDPDLVIGEALRLQAARLSDVEAAHRLDADAACRLEELRVKCSLPDGSPEEIAGNIGTIIDLQREKLAEVEAERDRAQSAACSICGSAQSHCAAVAHEQAETINRLGGAVEVLRKLMQWVDTHPRKATIVESLKSEARALLAAASVLALSSPSEQEEVR